MFNFKKVKKTLQPNFEVLAKKEFTRDNSFVNCVLDIQRWSPGKFSILEWIEKLEKDPTFSKNYTLNFGNTNDVFSFNIQTKDHLILLLDISYLLEKSYSIINNSTFKQESNYLINQLVGVVYLLQEIHNSLKKGVPLFHDTIMEASYTVHQLLDEKLNEYFELSTGSLELEIKIARDLRIEYQSRKELFNSNMVC